ERVGLAMRHADAPRTAVLGLTAAGERAGDPEFMRIAEAASLPSADRGPRTEDRAQGMLDGPGEAFAGSEPVFLGGPTTKRDMGTLARMLGTIPPALEKSLVEWAERGWLTYRGERRSPV